MEMKGGGAVGGKKRRQVSKSNYQFHSSQIIAQKAVDNPGPKIITSECWKWLEISL